MTTTPPINVSHSRNHQPLRPILCKRRIETPKVGRIEAKKTIMVTQLKAPIWVPGLSFSSTTPRTTLITTTGMVQYQYSDRVARPEKFTQFRKSDPIASKKV